MKVKSEVVFVAIRYCRCAGVRWRKVLRVLTCYFLFGSARPEVSIAMPERVMVPPFKLGMMKEEGEVGVVAGSRWKRKSGHNVSIARELTGRRRFHFNAVA